MIDPKNSLKSSGKSSLFTKSFFKKLFFGITLAALVFIVLNAGYFWKNLEFVLQKHKNPAATAEQSVPARAKPNMLWVDSLNIEAPVVYIDQTGEPAFQAGLKNGVVHYPGTAMPGQYGNDYIFGHSSDYIWSGGHYKTVFALLPKISDNAIIKISDSSGRVYTYVVTQHMPVNASDTQYLGQYDYKQRLLTLQTSYPVGTALRRYIVIAELK